MKAVSELSSPAPLLEPDDTTEERTEDNTLMHSTQPSTSAEGAALVYLIDPQTLPVDAEVQPTPVSESTQTELHLDLGDVAIVIQHRGRRLQPM